MRTEIILFIGITMLMIGVSWFTIDCLTGNFSRWYEFFERFGIAPRHPAPAYFFLIAIGIFLVLSYLWFVRPSFPTIFPNGKKKRENRKKVTVTSLWMWLVLFLLSVFSFTCFSIVLANYEQSNGFNLMHGDIPYYLLFGGVLYSSLGGFITYLKMVKYLNLSRIEETK